jgi:hypothetical protein
MGEEREVPNPYQAGGDNEVVLSLRLPGSSSLATRTLLPADEYQVKEVDVLVFHNNSYLYTSTGYELTDGDPSGEPGYVVAVKNFTVRLRPAEGNENKVDLWVLANARSMLGRITIEAGKTKAQIAAELQATETDGVTQATDAITATAIPMWGAINGVNVTQESGLGGNNKVNLIRMVAKIDVEVAAGNNFQLQEVHFYNRNIKGRIVPGTISASTWTAPSGIYVTVPSLPGGTLTATDNPKSYLSMTTLDISIKNTIYAFEAEKGTGYDANLNYKDEPCLVIGGSYNGGLTTYYRVDFVKLNADGSVNTYLDILRNYHYAVTIQSVSGPGLPSEEEALISRPVYMTADVIPWNMSDMSHVVIDGQYMLSVSRDSIAFCQDGGIEAINVFTDWEEGWKIDTKATSPPFPSWLTIKEPAPVSDMVNGTKGQKVPLVMEATALSSPGNREGEFYITAGRLKKLIKVEQVRLPFAFDHISSTGNIPREGGNPPTVGGAPLTMAFTGDYAGEFDIKAYASATPGTLGTLLVGTNKSNDLTAHPVNIAPNNSWYPRYITYTYSDAGIPEQTIDPAMVTNYQPGYSISVTGITPSATISAMGGTYTLTLSGNFPAGVEIYAVLSGTNTKLSNPVTLIANQASVGLTIDANPNATTRTLQIIASIGSSLTALTTYTQMRDQTSNGNYQLIFWMMGDDVPSDGTFVQIPETYDGKTVTNGFSLGMASVYGPMLSWMNEGGRAIGEITSFTDQVIAEEVSPSTVICVVHLYNTAVRRINNGTLLGLHSGYMIHATNTGADSYLWEHLPYAQTAEISRPVKIYLQVYRP